MTYTLREIEAAMTSASKSRGMDEESIRELWQGIVAQLQRVDCRLTCMAENCASCIDRADYRERI